MDISEIFIFSVAAQSKLSSVICGSSTKEAWPPLLCIVLIYIAENILINVIDLYQGGTATAAMLNKSKVGLYHFYQKLGF